MIVRSKEDVSNYKEKHIKILLLKIIIVRYFQLTWKMLSTPRTSVYYVSKDIGTHIHL